MGKKTRKRMQQNIFKLYFIIRIYWGKNPQPFKVLDFIA